jgi:hypothetical protein
MVAELVKTIKPKALNIPAVKQRIERVLQAEGDAIAEFDSMKTRSSSPLINRIEQNVITAVCKR